MSTQNPPKKRSVSEQKRIAILDAAKAAFIEQGFLATSMDSVASRAGVSKRTVYNHFPSKEDLFTAITIELIEVSAQSMQLAYDSDLSLRDQLLAIAFTKVELMTNDDLLPLSRLILSETIRSPDKVTRVLSEVEQSERPFIQFLEDATQAGRLSIDNHPRAAAQFFSLIKGEVFWPMIIMGQEQPSSEDINDICVKAVDMFLSYYAI